VATKLRRAFSYPARVENITPLMLPPATILGEEASAVRGTAERLSAQEGVWTSAAAEACERISAAGGVGRYVESLPALDELPSPAHTIELAEGFSFNPRKIPFKSGVLGFDLAYRDAVLGRFSFEPYYDGNPYFRGAEIYRAVSPVIRGVGISGRFGDFGERLLGELGFGYVISLPGHPATCVDVVSRGYRPLPRLESLSKALFSSEGGISFAVQHTKDVEVQRIIAEGSRIENASRRRDFYADQIAGSLFHTVRKNGRVNYVPDYYFMRELRDPPRVRGLDAEILSGRSLPWDEYQEEVERKKRLMEGRTSEDVHQDARDRMREGMLRRVGI